MDGIEGLRRENEELRRLAAEVEAALGPRTDVGWDDRVACDLARLRETEERFARELAMHEAAEERLIAQALRERLAARVDRAHRTLERLTSLLRTVSLLCDGSHVHAVRTTVSRLREELDEHLAYEERELFPSLIPDEPGRNSPQ